MTGQLGTKPGLVGRDRDCRQAKAGVPAVKTGSIQVRLCGVWSLYILYIWLYSRVCIHVHMCVYDTMYIHCIYM